MSFTESVDEMVAADQSGLLRAHPTWVRVRLADVCSILNGFPFASKQFKPSGGTPLIRIRDVVRGRTETHFVGDFDATFIVRHGELVVGMDGDFNCALWSGGDALLNQRVCKLTPDERHYDLRVLAHALPGYLGAINSKTSAITVKHLSSKTVAEIPLPLPPRQEQTRLAEVLESHFTRLDDAVATLERVQRNLERYRASVLKAAVEGRLVPTEAELARAEGRSYEPASVLLTRILAERRRRWEEAELAKMTAKGKAPKDDTWKAKYVEPVAPDTSELPELPEGWCWASGDQLTAVITKGSSPNWQGFDYCEAGIPFVRSQNIRWGYLDLDDLARLPVAFNEKERRSVLHSGDVLLNIVGASIGRSAVATEILSGGNANQAVAILRPQSGISPSYLCQYLTSPPCQALIHATKVDVARANLSLADISRFPFPVPPECEQSRITAELERNFSIMGEASEVSTTNSIRCRRLRQSILKWAFEGRLVDQDPNDEPASVLLERIRAERDAARAEPARAVRKTRSKMGRA